MGARIVCERTGTMEQPADQTVMLVPLDGSEASAAALPYAEAIAAALGCSLLLVTVVDKRRDEPLGPSKDVHDHLERIHQQREEEYLGAVATDLAARGVTATPLVAIGDPVDEILATAERPEVGLVAIASHGHGGLKHWLVGGVADKVIRSSVKPVLVVKPPEPGSAARSVFLKSMMVPLDGSELAEAALEPAVRLAEATNGVVTLVRVDPFLSRAIPGNEFVPGLESEDEGIAEHGMLYLDAVKDRMASGAQVETLLLRGDVDDNLIEFALHQGVDLVVMSKHGHGGLRRLVMGSTADRLVRSGAPVLLIRPQDGEDASGRR